MPPSQEVLDFYAHPTAMTSLGKHAEVVDELPNEIAGLVGVVQGLLLHEHMAGHVYAIELSDERRSESHIRPVAPMLDLLLARDAAPLTVARSPEERLVGTCRDFTTLLVALLRAKGMPARARCGFGSYFIPGRYEDHWVADVWDDARSRWVRVDAQIDEAQAQICEIDFDLLDVPHDRFVIAGDAWVPSRAGDADAAAFGLSFLEEGGFWFIAGNIVRDAAALNGVEMLPWDVWGGMPAPDEPLTDDLLTFQDRLAVLTRSPDAAFDELRALYRSDERLRVPATVYNAVLKRHEPVAA